MSEINCLVIFNNSTQFELNMDSQVTFGMVNDQIRKNFNFPDNVPLQFSYLDNEEDTIRVSSEVEFKEFLENASNLDFITLLVSSDSISEISPIPLPEAIPVLSIVGEKVPQKEPKQTEELKEQPNFNIKYQIPLIRNRRMGTPINHPPINSNGVKVQIARGCRVICDNCKEEITNLRYKCLQCPDYDLCEKCEDLKCKQENNQIHPDDHIFAKIPQPVQRPIPNFPHRRNFHRFSAPRCPRIHSTLLNNNNNNNEDKVDKPSENFEDKHNQRHNEKRKEWSKRFQQRGERIKELEDRVQVLEQEISQVLSTLRSSSVNNNNNNDHRKNWAFQC